MASLVQIVDHDPGWAALFQREAAAIRDRLGPLAEVVHHVGSTSIPGMAAKPVIDICVESAEFPPSDVVIGGLADLGYLHRGQGSVAGRHWFSKGEPRSHHLHWCPRGGAVSAAMVAFRDKAIRNPALAAEYAACKWALAGVHEIDSLDYVLAKEPFIRRILDAPG